MSHNEDDHQKGVGLDSARGSVVVLFVNLLQSTHGQAHPREQHNCRKEVQHEEGCVEQEEPVKSFLGLVLSKELTSEGDTLIMPLHGVALHRQLGLGARESEDGEDQEAEDELDSFHASSSQLHQGSGASGLVGVRGHQRGLAFLVSDEGSRGGALWVLVVLPDIVALAVTALAPTGCRATQRRIGRLCLDGALAVASL